MSWRFEVEPFPFKDYYSLKCYEGDELKRHVIIRKKDIKDFKNFISKNLSHSETDVRKILKKDGIAKLDFQHENIGMVNIQEIIKGNSSKEAWSRRLINTENNSATLIAQMPGEATGTA